MTGIKAKVIAGVKAMVRDRVRVRVRVRVTVTVRFKAGVANKTA